MARRAGTYLAEEVSVGEERELGGRRLAAAYRRVSTSTAELDQNDRVSTSGAMVLLVQTAYSRARSSTRVHIPEIQSKKIDREKPGPRHMVSAIRPFSWEHNFFRQYRAQYSNLISAGS
eukprot:853043-Rhodomonas_salina.2